MGPWPTLAKWSSLAQCFGGPGQHWHNGHHWHSVLVVMVNTDTMVIIGTVFWWSRTSLAQWTSLTQCFGGHGHHWHSVWWPWSNWHNGHHWHSGQHWHSGHHWHSVLVAMVNIGTVVQRNKTLMLSVVMACTSSSTISLVASNDIFTSGVFCQGTQANSSQSLNFIFVIWKNLLNKQSIWSRFIMKVVL